MVRKKVPGIQEGDIQGTLVVHLYTTSSRHKLLVVERIYAPVDQDPVNNT
jgi:hypothetical protein